MHASKLLGNVAALNQHSNLFEQPLAIELRPGSSKQALGEALLVKLLNLRAQHGHSFGRLGQPVERRVEDRIKRLSLASTHDLQLIEQRANLLLHALSQSSRILVTAIFSLQSAGQPQNGIQVRI